MFQKVIFLLLLSFLITGCSQERPSTFSSKSGSDEVVKEDSVGDHSSNIQALVDAIVNDDFDSVKNLTNVETVNGKDDLGNTPLMVAVQYMDEEIIKFLLENGADPMIADDLGVTPMAMALESENEEIVNLLKSHTSK